MPDLVAIAQEYARNTMLESLGILFTRVEQGYIEATMPVDKRTHQPYGLLHGGASAALAETLGSYGSHIIQEKDGGLCLGIELNINHIRGKRDGLVTGKAKIIHQGGTLHIWNIEVVDENEKLIAVSRLTVMVRKKP